MSTAGVPWERVAQLFEALEHLSDQERRAEILAVHEVDPALAVEVESLLAASRGQDRVGAVLAHVQDVFDSRTDGQSREGQRAGEFLVGALLGKGGMGSVYLGTDTRGDPCAIKFLDSPEVGHLRRRFDVERVGLERLRHPCICRLVSSGVTEDQTPYLVTELVDGVPIDEFLDGKAMSVRDRMRVLAEVCDTVHYAHGEGVLHRDLKPSNILVRDDGSHVLVDFGIAKLVAPGEVGQPTTLTRQAKAFTPHFASPEQLAGDPLSARADVYSLGVLGYVIASGMLPEYTPDGSTRFGRPRWGTLAVHASLRTATCAELERTLAGPLGRILRKATAVRPERRYPTVERLAQSLREWAAGSHWLATATSEALHAMRHRLTRNASFPADSEAR